MLPQQLTLDQMQNKWATVLEPYLANPQAKGLILKNISLINGVTIINHKLSRVPQGWQIIDINGAATVYRSQPFNNLTLTLTSSAAVTVALYVF